MRSITINQATMLNDFKEMWIPCTEQEYPEVKALLEEMGCNALWKISHWTSDCIGVITYSDGIYQSTVLECQERPTFTLSELRAMAKPNNDLRLLKERVGIMERSVMGMESKIDEIHKLLIKQ